LTNFNISQASY